MLKIQIFRVIRKLHTIRSPRTLHKARVKSNTGFASLHTIVSQETIKPSSPTPPHLKTHYLSTLDQFAPNIHLPMIFFYKNYNNGDINILKKSLSQSLTKYYPLAGTFPAPSASYIDCNDAGVEFLEALSSSRLNDFILKKEQDKTLDQLIPHALGCEVNKTSPNMAAVQVNRFACGGAAMAVSISHKVADGFTIGSFLSHWAMIARGGSPVDPIFIPVPPSRMIKSRVAEFTFNDTGKVKFATRRFMFPDAKLKELKDKINNMGTTPVNPTRVEALVSLLFKCSVSAATSKSKSGGYIRPSKLNLAVNARKCITNFPDLVAGNIFVAVSMKLMVGDSGHPIKLNEVIAKLREEMMEYRGLRSLEEVQEKFVRRFPMVGDDQSSVDYSFTSVCRFPLYEIDFGWGKPVQVMGHFARGDGNIQILMDSPTGDGIEATMQLEEEEMAFFLKDKELLTYACISYLEE